MLYRRYIDTILTLHRRCIDTILTLYRCYTDAICRCLAYAVLRL